jgi:hypothetical protein
MKYEHIIKTVSEIVDNENIYKNGMTLVYKLNEENHRRMNEELFYKSNPVGTPFTPNEEFEVELGGIIVKFIVDKPETLE